jgi:hypothetical protein
VKLEESENKTNCGIQSNIQKRTEKDTMLKLTPIAVMKLKLSSHGMKCSLISKELLVA